MINRYERDPERRGERAVSVSEISLRTLLSGHQEVLDAPALPPPQKKLLGERSSSGRRQLSSLSYCTRSSIIQGNAAEDEGFKETEEPDSAHLSSGGLRQPPHTQILIHSQQICNKTTLWHLI